LAGLLEVPFKYASARRPGRASYRSPGVRVQALIMRLAT
jgi:hypothetical protein